MADGDIHQAEFDSPHGLVEYNSCIYVADTNNHAIRVVSRERHEVIPSIFCSFDSIVRSHVTACAHIDRHWTVRFGQDRRSQTISTAHRLSMGLVHHRITL